MKKQRNKLNNRLNNNLNPNINKMSFNCWNNKLIRQRQIKLHMKILRMNKGNILKNNLIV